MKKEIDIENLFIVQFPEFQDIKQKVSSDRKVTKMLEDLYQCDLVMEKFLKMDDRRETYSILKQEIIWDIKKYIIEKYLAK